MEAKQKIIRSREYLTIQDIANILGCGYNTARHIMLNDLNHVQFGRMYRVREQEFRKYMKRLECSPATEGETS